MADLNHWKMAACHLSAKSARARVPQICKHFEQISIWFSFTQNYALNVIVWVRVPFSVIKEKMYEFLRERCEEVYNHKLCIYQFASVLWASLCEHVD